MSSRVRNKAAVLAAVLLAGCAGQATAPLAPVARGASALEQAVAELDPDTLAPRDALAALYRLKALQDKS